MTRCEWLRARWQRLGFTPRSLAETSGISVRTLQRIGRAGPDYPISAVTLTRLAGPLKLTAAAATVLLTSEGVDPSLRGTLDAAPDALSPVSRDEFNVLAAKVDALRRELEAMKRCRG